MATATLLRPSAAALAEAYFLKAPAKIGYLRADSLAMLVSFANVGAHARVLVVEACAGLVLGAVAERLGGHGVVRPARPSSLSTLPILAGKPCSAVHGWARHGLFASLMESQEGHLSNHA